MSKYQSKDFPKLDFCEIQWPPKSILENILYLCNADKLAFYSWSEGGLYSHPNSKPTIFQAPR